MAMNNTSFITPVKDGFALLLTLVVVGIVLAIGLTILQITMKQVSLANIARESEVSFFAASTGIECMQYYRSIPSIKEALLAGTWPYPLRCADSDPIPGSAQFSAILENGGTNQYLFNYRYRYELSYDPLVSSDNTCVETSLYIADLTNSNRDINETVSNEGLAQVTCEAGLVCTTIFSRGYNRPCDQLDSIFTVQRELTIEY